MNFESFFLLTESFKNLFTPDQKTPYAQAVWDLIQTSYAPIGGIKGSGFASPEDMVQNVPMWKVATKDGVPKVVILYKDKEGRKLVAVGTDGSFESKQILVNILRSEFTRSYAEVSGPLLRFIKKVIPDASSFAIPAEQVKTILPNDEIIPVDEFEYQREIGGEMIQKMMIGTRGKTIQR